MTFEIAMFPLGTVLLPGAPLPLHIFEDRYREMIHDALHGEMCFGVTLIARGLEVGGGEERTSVGVLAVIVEAQCFEDGRWAIGAVGGRRFQVVEWLPDDPYPLARIEFWPDKADPAPAQGQVSRVLSLIAEVAGMGVRLGYSTAVTPEVLPSDPVELSYALTASSPLGPTDRHDLLCCEGPSARLELLEQRLVDQRILFGAQIAMSGGDQEPI